MNDSNAASPALPTRLAQLVATWQVRFDALAPDADPNKGMNEHRRIVGAVLTMLQACIQELKAVLAESGVGIGPCHWSREETYWASACGEQFQFIPGSAVVYKFCPECGRRVELGDDLSESGVGIGQRENHEETETSPNNVSREARTSLVQPVSEVDSASRVVKPLSEWLQSSLRCGLLFGRHDEPLNAYGKRIVRVILSEVEHHEAGGVGIGPSEEKA
jgi:hypothetical protein